MHKHAISRNENPPLAHTSSILSWPWHCHMIIMSYGHRRTLSWHCLDCQTLSWHYLGYCRSGYFGIFFWYVLDVLVGSILVSVGSVIGFGAHCSPPQYPLKACLPRRQSRSVRPAKSADSVWNPFCQSLQACSIILYYFHLFSYFVASEIARLPKIAAHPTCETVRHWNHWKSSPPGALR